MALIPKFTNTDPNARVSFSFKRSSRRQLDLYRHFYKEQYGDVDLPERGPLVEQIVVALLAKDPDFKKWMDGLKKGGAVLTGVDAGLDREEGTEPKARGAAPIQVAAGGSVVGAAATSVSMPVGSLADAATSFANGNAGTTATPAAPAPAPATTVVGAPRPFGSFVQSQADLTK
jgi:hypothetical protein